MAQDTGEKLRMQLQNEGLEENSREFVGCTDAKADLLVGAKKARDRYDVGFYRNSDTGATAMHTKRVVLAPTRMDRFLLAHLNATGVFDLPPQKDVQGLLDLYFERVNPLVPLVDRSVFNSTYEKGMYSYPLLHAMLLSVCRLGEARRFLRGTDVRTFAAHTYMKIQGMLFAGLEKNPYILTRVYALMASHAEGPDGFQEAYRNLSQAISHAYMLGMHLTDMSSPNMTWLSMWRSLWCLDKFMAAVSGMPMISNPLDFGADALDYVSGGPDDDFYRSCRLIEQTIHQYRPNGDRRVPPRVSIDLALRQNATPDEAALCRLVQATARILSYKRATGATSSNGASTNGGSGGGGGGGPNSEPPGTPGQTPSDADMVSLMEASAIEILNIVEMRDVLAFPLIPYAVSLTFSVFIKYFNSPNARMLWKRACELLDRLADTWWAAEAMASMGRSVFEKLENESQAAIDTQLGILGDDAVVPGFFDQADIFGEFDKSVVNYWFPADQTFA